MNDTTTPPRHYYDDPLAAAWMAKHHGMKLVRYADTVEQAIEYECEQGDQWDWMTCLTYNGMGSGDLDTTGDVLKALADAGRAYIHPDSVPLLRPQRGDIIRLKDFVVAQIVAVRPEFVDLHHSRCQQPNFDDRFERIIERGGQAFHWPLVEV